MALILVVSKRTFVSVLSVRAANIGSLMYMDSVVGQM
jgi:hypothetical protein